MNNNSILIIDDNDSIRDALSWSLSNKGYESITAANGQEAWDILEKNESPALILLDIMMPVMDGYEFRRRQNAHARFSKIHTVIVSARQNLELSLHSNEMLLPKPFDLHFLLKIIKERMDFLFQWDAKKLEEYV